MNDATPADRAAVEQLKETARRRATEVLHECHVEGEVTYEIMHAVVAVAYMRGHMDGMQESADMLSSTVAAIESDGAAGQTGGDSATATHTTPNGARVSIVRLEPPVAYGRQAVVRYEDGTEGYVGLSILTPIDGDTPDPRDFT